MGGEHYLTISAPLLLQFGKDTVLKIGRKGITELMNESVNDKGVCRTAPATPGLLIIYLIIVLISTCLSTG